MSLSRAGVRSLAEIDIQLSDRPTIQVGKIGTTTNGRERRRANGSRTAFRALKYFWK